MKCKICAAEAIHFGNGRILGKYDIDYFQCENCGFVQTEEPYWLEEAYTSAIGNSDVGLVFRNTLFAKITSNIIFSVFAHDQKFVDYGGGYGLFVRLMRDAGFDFYWYDKYCQNIFAEGFEAEVRKNGQYELLTAFEVFEHFVNPLDEIKNILNFSRNILFSTELLPENNPKPDEWWYYSLSEGQHIAIYTIKALSIIAEELGLNLYSNGANLHLITEKTIPEILFESLAYCEPPERKKPSLMESDYWRVLGKSEARDLETGEIGQNLPVKTELKIIVDGVFFQLFKTGIARVWKSLLEEWVKDGFAEHIIVLDRAGTAPKIPKVKYRTIQLYHYSMTAVDRELLQQICDEEQADLFISSYYTTPISTPTVFMCHDMIPEVLGWDLSQPSWQEKHWGIRHATTYITVSENTSRDLVRFFPDISSEKITIAHCGVDSKLSPASSEKINNFKIQYGINKPYFLLVGARIGYKNAILFFQAFGELYSKQGFEIVCSSFDPFFEPEFRAYTSGVTVHKLQLNDEELKAAYSGAVALVFPSEYEGFGLPILEAFACGCPVITCPNASIPEVAGSAALYVNHDDVQGMANALCDVQKPAVRNLLIAAGMEQVKKFSWTKMADKVRSVLVETSLQTLNLRAINLIVFADWLQSEETIYGQLAAVIKAAGIHPDRHQITLLIDTSNLRENSEIDVNLILSSIVMNLLMQEDIDVTDGLEISLLGNINSWQWSILLPRIQARVILENENEKAIAQARVENLPLIQLNDLANTQLFS